MRQPRQKSKSRRGANIHIESWTVPLRNRTNVSDIDLLPEPALQTPQYAPRRYNRSISSSMESIPEPIIEIRSPPRFSSQPFIEAREQALHTLGRCRSLLISLEMTRMSKSRIGRRNWMRFWDRIYEAPLSRALCEEVDRVFSKVDMVFRVAAKDLCNLTFAVKRCLRAAKTEGDVITILEEMERVTIDRREMRRQAVMDILEGLRFSIERIPVDVSDELFDDLKRGVFALDPVGDYHPGDPEAEERDRQVNQPLEVAEFVRADPDLQWRAGFRDEFREAVERVTEEQENISPTSMESMEEWVNNTDSS
ncbi:hypothetical protein FQN54_003418 [Arachnomyces sp. PD_36]|nr:hypothetical protein FQN54_003418 [Arachnomyces sp. PD_36]